VTTGYRTWGEAHAAGVEAAAAKTAARRLSGPALAEHRRLMKERHPCKVKGCKRTAYKGSICKAHWDTIPQRSKVELVVAVIQAEVETAARFHRRFLTELNRKPSASA
jgi:hypothetical protein